MNFGMCAFQGQIYCGARYPWNCTQSTPQLKVSRGESVSGHSESWRRPNKVGLGGYISLGNAVTATGLNLLLQNTYSGCQQGNILIKPTVRDS